VIQLNGDKPPSSKVGATYNDLGATIQGPTADLNLGLTAYLNGTLTSTLTRSGTQESDNGLAC
jgi:hypothetical protein